MGLGKRQTAKIGGEFGTPMHYGLGTGRTAKIAGEFGTADLGTFGLKIGIQFGTTELGKGEVRR